MLLIYFVLTHLLMNCKRSEKLRLYCNEETRCIGWIDRLAIWMVDRSTCDLDGGSIDLRFGWWIDRLAIWMVDRSTCDLDGVSIDFSAGSMPALKSVDHFIKVSAKYKMLLHPARPMICQSTFLYLADLTRL